MTIQELLAFLAQGGANFATTSAANTQGAGSGTSYADVERRPQTVTPQQPFQGNRPDQGPVRPGPYPTSSGTQGISPIVPDLQVYTQGDRAPVPTGVGPYTQGDRAPTGVGPYTQGDRNPTGVGPYTQGDRAPTGLGPYTQGDRAAGTSPSYTPWGGGIQDSSWVQLDQSNNGPAEPSPIVDQRDNGPSVTYNPPPDLGGDVFEWIPPENKLTPQLQDIYQNMLDVIQGNAEIPYLADLSAQQKIDQAREMDDLAQRLHMRGIGNSTIGDIEYGNMGTQQRAGQTQLALDTLQRAFQPQLQLAGQVYGQGASARQQSLDEFMQFLDAQFRSDRAISDDEYRALSMMLQAAGLNTAPSYAPNFGTQEGQPTAWEDAGGMYMDWLPWLMSNYGGGG